MAWKTVWIACPSPWARRIAASRSAWARRIEDSRSPSALRMADCLLPSAVRIADWRSPSAVRMAARLSRSARICFSIESLIDGGGSMPLISTRFTRTPHLPVASSRTPRRPPLMDSREVSVSSRSMPPTMLRSVVIVSCSMAWM